MNNNISRDEYDDYIRSVKKQIEEINRKIKLLPDLIKKSKISYENWYKQQIDKK
jgi:predicted DNA-binding protein YlxM (UPF0122 family)